MSLYCVMCSKCIVMSKTPTHYGVCAACPTNELTDDMKRTIEKGFGIRDISLDKLMGNDWSGTDE